jgi:hypothetical protein
MDMGDAGRLRAAASERTWSGSCTRARTTLAPTDEPDVFTVDPGYRQSGELVRFERAADGRVVLVFLAVASMQRLEPVPGE